MLALIKLFGKGLFVGLLFGAVIGPVLAVPFQWFGLAAFLVFA